MEKNSQINVNNKPFYKKSWFIVIAIIFSILIIWFAVSAAVAMYMVKSGRINIDNLENQKDKLSLQIISSGLDPNIYTTDDPSFGNSNADIWIVEFFDFQCPFCKESAPITKRLLSTYPNDVFYIFRDFPIDNIHPQARLAAEAANCANDQDKFWEYHDKLFTNQSKLETIDLIAYAKQIGINLEEFNDCLSSGKYQAEVEDDLQAGLEAGVDGTPSYFVNGQKINGAVPWDAWEDLIRQSRKSDEQ